MNAVFVISFIALWALVLFQTLLLLGLTRSVHLAVSNSALEDPSANENTLRDKPAPNFRAADLSGKVFTNEDLLGRAAALLFVSPDCENCAVTLLELEALSTKVEGVVVVVCRSEVQRCVQLAQTYGLDIPVIADEDLSLSRTFHVAGSPTAVLLRSDGTIEKFGHPMNTDELEASVVSAGWGERSSDGEIPNNGNSNGDVSLHVTEMR